MIDIGPYRFSETDARKTVQLRDYLWEQYELGRDHTSIDALRTTIDALRPTIDGSDLAADLHAVWAALSAAGPALRGAGQMPATCTGSVAHLAVASAAGGVPKQPVDRVDVGWAGIDGDRQAHRQHHGRPWQALCLWSTEVIERFRAEGDDLFPGAAGENITLTGFDWAHVRPGVRLQLGGAHPVVCEVTAFAEPCSQNAHWFHDGDFGRIAKERGPVSRAYAVVLRPGSISVGDPAVLEP